MRGIGFAAGPPRVPVCAPAISRQDGGVLAGRMVRGRITSKWALEYQRDSGI